MKNDVFDRRTFLKGAVAGSAAAVIGALPERMRDRVGGLRVPAVTLWSTRVAGANRLGACKTHVFMLIARGEAGMKLQRV